MNCRTASRIIRCSSDHSNMGSEGRRGWLFPQDRVEVLDLGLEHGDAILQRASRRHRGTTSRKRSDVRLLERVRPPSIERPGERLFALCETPERLLDLVD